MNSIKDLPPDIIKFGTPKIILRQWMEIMVSGLLSKNQYGSSFHHTT